MYTVKDFITIHGRKIYMSEAPTTLIEASEFGRLMKLQSISPVIILMTNQEIRREFGNTDSLMMAYRNEGLKPEHFPIIEDGIPQNTVEMMKLMTHLISLLKSGHDIMIHCLGGVSRTGLVVAGLLIALGMPLQGAIHTLEVVRKFVGTEKQRAFLKNYEIYLNSNHIRT